MMADVERAQRTSCGRFCSVTGAASCCSTATDAEAAARARKSSTRWMLICPETAGPTERKLLSSTPSSNHGFGETLCRLPESSAGGKMWPTSVGVCATGISGSPAARSPPIQKGRCERRWSVHLRDTAGSAPRGYSERSPDRYPWSTAGTLLSANSRVRSKLGFRRTGHDPGTIVAKPDGVNASTRGRQSGAQLCTDLVKRYGDLTAVDGLDLTVEPRRVLWPAGSQRGRQDHHHRDLRRVAVAGRGRGRGAGVALGRGRRRATLPATPAAGPPSAGDAVRREAVGSRDPPPVPVVLPPGPDRKTGLGVSRGRVTITKQFSIEPSWSINWIDPFQGASTTNLVGTQTRASARCRRTSGSGGSTAPAASSSSSSTKTGTPTCGRGFPSSATARSSSR